MFVAQVWKRGGDLRRGSATHAFQWRRSPGKNLTCAKKWRYLRQQGFAPTGRGASSGGCGYGADYHLIIQKTLGKTHQGLFGNTL